MNFDPLMTVPTPASSQPSLQQLTGLLKLLADPTRLNILMLLANGERNVSSLCDELKLPQPTVSHHLGLLRMNSVLNNRRDGKQVFYSLSSRIDGLNLGEISVAAENYTVRIAPRTDAARLPVAAAMPSA